MHVFIKDVFQFFWHASFAPLSVWFNLCFDLFGKWLFKVFFFSDLFIADFKFVDDFSNSNSSI